MLHVPPFQFKIENELRTLLADFSMYGTFGGAIPHKK
jgi:hypothetical protein